MRNLHGTARKSFCRAFGNFCHRCAGIALIAAAVLLCAPFLSPPHKEPRLGVIEPPAPNTADGSVRPESRVGVKVRSGDTLGSLLKRFGVAPPSAHALIEEVRPFVNPRKIRPGDDVHVVLDPQDRTGSRHGICGRRRFGSRQSYGKWLVGGAPRYSLRAPHSDCARHDQRQPV